VGGSVSEVGQAHHGAPSLHASARDVAPASRRRSLTALLVGLDASVALATLITAYVVRFGTGSVFVGDLDYRWVVPLVVLFWVGSLALKDAYDQRVLGEGAEEYKRVLEGSFRAFAVTAIVAYTLKEDVARGVVLASFPVGAALLCAERYAVRQWLVRRRVRGAMSRRTVVVGSRASARDLVRRLRMVPHIGYDVVGVAVTSGETSGSAEGIRLLPAGDDLVESARAAGAETIAVTSCPEISPEYVRDLAWRLEGSGIALVVAPSVAEVAAPRVRVQPAAGLTLLHLEEPAFHGARRVLKETQDRLGAALLLVLLAPLLLVSAASVRLSSPGPAIFHQQRIGRHGEPFRVLKLRTMYADAESRLTDLLESNESDGKLFKLREDPRITPVGRWLRRLPLDELPQLVNVLRGQMSLVGPRPLPVEGESFAGHERRRLLVKPGMTGLWQVSGRSDLSWAETVRLDLYYVDNWSPSLDALILFRTLRAVIRADGAY
jgi:exopolysaccharide biosynthesis polyprenyl glycosylphosphotransferase